MEKYLWTAQVLSGKLNEYIQMHNEIWPEMVDALNNAGIHNYTIWSKGDKIVGYYECENIRKTMQIQDESAVVAKWRAEMKNLIVMDNVEESGSSKVFKQVFCYK